MGLDYNLDMLLDKLNNLEKRLKSSKAKEILLAGAQPILEGQKEYVPVKTGKLYKTLDTGKFSTRKSGQQVLHIGIVHDEEREAVYGYYQHYGHRRMVGTYWITASFRSRHKQATDAMIKKLREVIKE